MFHNHEFVCPQSNVLSYTQLSVTVTPGLPPLLISESYQCRFADRDRLRVITVDAEEVTPNTAYQCNITGRIPTFTDVQLGKMNCGAMFLNAEMYQIAECTTVIHRITKPSMNIIALLMVYVNSVHEQSVNHIPTECSYPLSMFGQHQACIPALTLNCGACLVPRLH